MSKTAHVLTLVSLLLPGCATVRHEDLAAWRGRPVAELDRHPVFATLRLTKTYAADGTELRERLRGDVMRGQRLREFGRARDGERLAARELRELGTYLQQRLPCQKRDRGELYADRHGWR